jgi:hypothetical protein
MPDGATPGDSDPATALHERLVATETLPVERDAGWRLGEAQALAADIATGDPDAAVVRERADEIQTLLAAIDGTGDETADEHVAAARELAAQVADRSEDASKA